MTKKLIAGNWKLNGSLGANASLLAELLTAPADLAAVDCAVCVPFPYLAQVGGLLAESGVALAAQDVSEFGSGAYTGEVSAGMLAEFGCRYVIVGHSERRALFAEGDQQVGRKAAAALAHGLVPIVCVGETLAERDEGRAMDVIGRQLDAVGEALDAASLERVVIAYEPVWAIGTGRSASVGQVVDVHQGIRRWLAARCETSAAVRILYGGSVKPENAGAIFAAPDVDGGLIGGASLVARDFLAICRAAVTIES